ncbi:MAG TPA: D-glycerate dehydrogenase [Solirubrobacteraceae bacterium]|nr:D-glycerate dehydrogenase [Solirubrobacteraceae bacterium]
MARVVVTRRLPFPALERAREAHDLTEWPGQLPPPPDVLRELLADAEGALCLLTDRIDATVLDAAPRLRVISNYAVGADNVDLDEARRRGIAVGVTPGVLTEATADLAMALILAAARRLPEAAIDVHAGNWHTWEPAGWLGLELRGATLAVVGHGRIGEAVAERARAFGMDVLPVGRDTPLRDALAEADVISLHVPLTPETHHLIDAEALASTKPGAILVNTARGGLVDTAALLEALDDGRLAAAALDVTDPEPLPPDHPLLRHPNVLVVPHIGSATHATRERMAELAVDNLLAGLEGRPLPHPAGG